MGSLRTSVIAGAIGLASLLSSGKNYADEPVSVQPDESALIDAINFYKPTIESRKDLATKDPNVNIKELYYTGNARGQTMVSATLSYKDGKELGVVFREAPYRRSRYMFFELDDGKFISGYAFIPGHVENDDEKYHSERERMIGYSLVIGDDFGSRLEKSASGPYQKVTDLTVGKYEDLNKRCKELSDIIGLDNYIKRTIPRNIEPFFAALPKEIELANYTTESRWASVPSYFDASNVPLPRLTPTLAFLADPSAPFSNSSLQPVPDFPANKPDIQPATDFPAISESFFARKIKSDGISMIDKIFVTLTQDLSIDTVISYRNKLPSDEKTTLFEVELFDKDGDGTLDRVTFGNDRELDFIRDNDGIKVEGPYKEMYTPSSAWKIFQDGKDFFTHVKNTFSNNYRTLQLSNSVLRLLPKKDQEKSK